LSSTGPPFLGSQMLLAFTACFGILTIASDGHFGILCMGFHISIFCFSAALHGHRRARDSGSGKRLPICIRHYQKNNKSTCSSPFFTHMDMSTIRWLFFDSSHRRRLTTTPTCLWYFLLHVTSMLARPVHVRRTTKTNNFLELIFASNIEARVVVYCI